MDPIPSAMSQAVELAEKAAGMDEVPVGAVVLQGSKIIGRGFNLRESRNDPTAHAEVLAIQDACKTLGDWRLQGCTLVVTLEPCPMCLGALQQARVEKVYYGARDPKGGALSLGIGFHQDKRLNHRFEVEHLESAEAGKILTEFFRKKRKGSI